MSTNSEQYIRAVEQFGRVVTAANPALWDAPSPCTEWTARDVAGHVIAVQYAIIATIAGERAPMNPMQEPGRHAGDDPVAAWTSAHAAIVAAIAEPDVLDRMVSTWRGEVTVDDMLGYNVGDSTIHAWDLARAVGGNDRLDPDLVAAAIEILAPVADAMRGPNMFADSVDVERGADPQTRLLAMVGRAG